MRHVQSYQSLPSIFQVRNQADFSTCRQASPASALKCRQAGNLETSSLLLPCQQPPAQAPAGDRTPNDETHVRVTRLVYSKFHDWHWILCC